MNFYGTYILRNLSSEAKQNIIIKPNREQGRAKVIVRTRDNRRFMVEKQYGINICLEFFLEDSCSFRCFQSDGEFIPDPRRSGRESRFAQVKFCFRHNKL